MHTLVLLAAIYGSLTTQSNLVYAPPTVNIGDANYVTSHITEPQANALGYKLVEDFAPATDSNHYAVAVGWSETNRIYRVYDVKETPLPPRKFSKLKIYGAIISLPDSNGTSAWQKIQAWLEAKTIDGVNGWMAFQLAQELSEDHPLFAVLADEARQLLGLTKEQFDVILNQCILEN